MYAGAVADAAHIQVQHFAGETVLHAVDTVACGDEAPLLPLCVSVVPQLDLGAVLNIIISHLNDLAVGGIDGVVLTCGNHGLCDLLLSCHIGYLPIHKTYW